MSYKTKDQLVSEANSLFASAKPGKIIAEDFRTFFSDLLDSYPNVDRTAPNTGNMFPYSGCEHYWKLNELGVSTTKIDSTGSANLIATNAFPSLGKIQGESAVSFRSDSLSEIKYNGINIANYTGGFTACAWFKRIPRTPDNTYDCVMGIYSSAGTNNDQWMLYRENTLNNYDLVVRQDDGSYVSLLFNQSNLQTPPANEWQFLSASCDYSTNPKWIKVYVNGLLAATGALGAGKSIEPNPGSYFGIGAYALGGGAQIQHSNSEIGSAGIWSRALSSGEIKALYNNGYGIAF